MKLEFVKCGLLGWCMEVLWTGINSYFKKDRKLTCNTSIWMFPIYGMASFLKPLNKLICRRGILCRGIIYTICFFTIEYTTGIFLKKRDICPWDYSSAKFNYKGVIRYDFAPLWFLAGLFYENILGCISKPQKKSK